ncbi:Acetyl esterase/lipase [Alteromonadaceae bacterium Bs31]|nr:Acetyl esterase/lipase [Alteromonadaceae bacterium Bs31]
MALLAVGLGACGGSGRESSSAQQVLSPTPAQPFTPTLAPTLAELPQTSVEVIAFQWGEEALQWGELYLPASAQEPWPTLVMIHGGCWQASYTLSLQAALSKALAERGYAVWNIEYRSLGSGGKWPVMFQDVAAATDYLAELSEFYPLNMDAIVAMGHSAGGHLALWLAGREKIAADSALYFEDFVSIKGTITLGGIADLQSGACAGAASAIIESAVLSEADLKTRLTNTSPINMLPVGKPTVLISGQRDGIVPPELSQAYYLAALAEGDSSEHIVLEGAGHFELINPQAFDLTIIDEAIERISGQ